MEGGRGQGVFFLQGTDIHPCDGCRKSNICGARDETCSWVPPELLSADALLLASPIYWFTYNAQLKTCMDRWYATWKGNHDFLKNKPVGIVLTDGDTDLDTSGEINVIHTLQTMFPFLEADISGWVYLSLMDFGDAVKAPELMEQAYLLGKNWLKIFVLFSFKS